MKKNISLIILFTILTALPVIVFAQVQYTTLAPLPGISASETIDEGFLSKYLNIIYILGISLCTALAVLMIVVGGVQWASSDAWSGKQEGKERIWAAVLGLFIALGSYVILNTINPALLNTELNFGEGTTSEELQSTPVGEKTPEEKRVAETTPTTRPQADPTYQPQFNEDGTLNVRSTYYYAGESNSDPDTDALRSSTGTPLRPATATQVGVAAVDPRVIPYGSLITIQTASGPRYYVAADTGGAVKNRTASQGRAPVIDFYSNSQVGGMYTDVKIQPYRGTTPYRNLTSSQRESFFNVNNFSSTPPPSGNTQPPSGGGVQFIPTPPAN